MLIQNQDTGTYQLATATSPSRQPEATPTPATAPVITDITATVALDDARLNVRWAGHGLRRHRQGRSRCRARRVRGRDATAHGWRWTFPTWTAASADRRAWARLSGPAEMLTVTDEVSSAPAFVAAGSPVTEAAAPSTAVATTGDRVDRHVGLPGPQRRHDLRTISTPAG
ncbi:MAG: hypothetical protein R2838_03530 [Caldilineaceae bacterium]